MFDTKFNTIADCLKINKMNESELIVHLKRYFDNQNYRNNYNKNKNELNKMLKDDPIVRKRFEELKAKAK